MAVLYNVSLLHIHFIYSSLYVWHPTPVLLPGKSHGRRSLVGCSPWGREESDTTEWLHFQFSLSCIGEGNGIPLQCSCLENPRGWGAWWAAVYGVEQSPTRLKRLSSSSSSSSSLYVLFPYAYLAPPTFPLPAGNYEFVLYILIVFLFCYIHFLFFLNFTYKW